MAYLFAILSAAGYGINDLCIHIGMRSGRATSAQALIINLLSGNLLLAVAGMAVYFTAGFPPLDWAGMLYFIAAGLSAPFLGRIFSFSSIKRIGATRTTTLRVSDTFFTMATAFILLKNVITFRSVVGAVLLVAGVVMLINETSRAPIPAVEGTTSTTAEEAATGEDTGTVHSPLAGVTHGILATINTGTLFALASAFFFALAGIFRQMALEYIPSAILGTIVGSFVALLTNSALTYLSGQLGSSWNITRRDAVFFALGGVGNTMGMLMFFLALAGGGSVSMTAALKNISPLFTIFLSWLFLRKMERFTVNLVASVLLVIAGASLIVF
ncbi:hypothetical protein SY88_12755 [Clostridiales bacterium PH28_bin88]|nr:hypothetical protein SY88_12755 [Clostridiales bacterium PH28_bin88]